MLILAFESSAKAASCALCRDGELLAQSYQNCGLTHSRTLLPMAESMLDSTGINMGEIDLFAVAHGPGSFTGIRIGVSAVKGLGWALDKPVCGVSTLEAMAWHGIAAPEGAVICAVMDARRGEVYNALFELRDGRPHRLLPDRAVSIELLRTELAADRDRIYWLLGDGAELSYGLLGGTESNAAIAPPFIRNQSAWGVAMAARLTVPVDPHELQPVYLRLSQAERERNERLAAGNLK